jgi:uncharacterized membrane protein YhfC
LIKEHQLAGDVSAGGNLVSNTNLYWSLVSAAGMMLVGAVAALFWRHRTMISWRWLWIGAALWSVAVLIKFAIAIPTNGPVFKYLSSILPGPVFLLVGGLYGGLQSSLCEIGLTWLAVLKWRDLGRDAARATGVGVGAGAFEAILLGLFTALGIVALLVGSDHLQAQRQSVDLVAERNPAFWLIASVERIIAILCHVSSRTLVLIGTTHRRPWMIFWGFAIFTILDGLVVVAHLSGAVGSISLWWIELAILPLALVSIPIIRRCCIRWGETTPSLVSQEV